MKTKKYLQIIVYTASVMGMFGLGAAQAEGGSCNQYADCQIHHGCTSKYNINASGTCNYYQSYFKKKKYCCCFPTNKIVDPATACWDWE